MRRLFQNTCHNTVQSGNLAREWTRKFLLLIDLNKKLKFVRKTVTSGDKKLCNVPIKVLTIAKVSFSPHKIRKSHFRWILNFHNEILLLSADVFATWLDKISLSTLFVFELFHRKPKVMRLKLPNNHLYNVNKAPHPNPRLNFCPVSASFLQQPPNSYKTRDWVQNWIFQNSNLKFLLSHPV